MATRIEFRVIGRPQQRGSKRALPFKRKEGGLGVRVTDMNETSKDWMQQVRSAAAERFAGPLLFGPIRLGVRFHFKRPGTHLGSGRHAGAVKESAPHFHAQQPDLSKLLRALEDGLTGVIWNDDRQVCRYTEDTGKYWTTGSEMAEITIEELSDLAQKEVGA